MSNLCKEAAIYLAVLCVRKPSRVDWENAIRVVSGRKGQKLSTVELGKQVMQVQFDFPNGIPDEFLAREMPPVEEVIIMMEPRLRGMESEIRKSIGKKEKDVPRKNKRTSRHKQVR